MTATTINARIFESDLAQALAAIRFALVLDVSETPAEPTSADYALAESLPVSLASIVSDLVRLLDLAPEGCLAHAFSRPLTEHSPTGTVDSSPTVP